MLTKIVTPAAGLLVMFNIMAVAEALQDDALSTVGFSVIGVSMFAASLLFRSNTDNDDELVSVSGA